MSELKPCPFCGGDGKVIKLNQKGFKGEFKVFIRCTNCILKTNTQYPLPHDSYLTRLERAINSWNSNLNPIADRLQQENEQLKELLRLAVGDMHHCDCCEVCKNHNNQPNCGSDCEFCTLDCECIRCMDEDLFTWQHSDKLKGLIEI